MGRVFRKKEEATPYDPKASDTFETIVAKCEAADPPITWQEVALYNWGTKEPNEVARALTELLGVRKWDDPDPKKWELDPARGIGKTVLLPKVMKQKGLAYTKEYKLKVKQQLPATAVSITSLDKWFLPGPESCDATWKVEGIKARAKKLDFDVYASNYCKATPTNDGDFVKYVYADTPDVPILQSAETDDAAERTNGAIVWRGDSKAADGVLKPRVGAIRYVNAASSPYTVMLRYYENDGQKNALLRLQSFWPRWSEVAGRQRLAPDCLKIKWHLQGCPAGMQGQFLVFDKNNTIVWRQAIPPGKCADGDQEIDWFVDGKAVVTQANMPYRVQIQIHTNKDTSPGLALAAMHTEVRLYCHPDTGTFGIDHEQETQVLELAQAPWLPGPAPPENSGKGRKLRLANAGYHPGPITDVESNPVYKLAVCEFQRDHQVPGANTRLRNDGILDDDTRRAIAAQPAARRPLFADSARADITDADAIKSALNDKDGNMVAWVDDRHNATELETAGAAAFLTQHMDLGDYRGGVKQSENDATKTGKQARDAASICRPWLPLEATTPILRKADALDSTNVPAITPATRRATGPIRVDWTFRDLAPEYNVDATQYSATRVRALRYLTTTMNDPSLKGTHNGKDAFNCTTALGGVRSANYYCAPFAFGLQSLAPWRSFDDRGNSVVCSVVHDDLGQEKNRVFATHMGKAGVYLYPSIIGGDGYQFRAQVNFRDLPGAAAATHPNWKVLRDRYDQTKLPQAHTARIRIWRKDSYRAHIQWASSHHWGDYDVQNMKFYKPGMVHWVYEGTGASPSLRATQIYPGAPGQEEYRTLVSGQIKGGMGIAKTDRYRPAAEMTLTDNTVWPWSTAKHLGVHGAPPPGTTLANYETEYQNQIRNDTWRSFRESLIIDMLSKIERDQGRLRGHLIGEFRASPQYWVEMYYCNGPVSHDQILIERAATGGTGVGEPCRVGACAGTLQSSIKEKYRCDACGFETTVFVFKALGGTACTAKCTGTMQQTAQVQPGLASRMFITKSVTTTYTCDTCGSQKTVKEAPASAGGKTGTVCGLVCPRHGTMQPVPGSQTPQEMAGPRADLSLPSWGGGLGGLFLDTKEGPRTYWAHETAHHKHLEHAGDKIDDAASPAQHDRAANTVSTYVPTVPNVNARMWDRDCIMSYVNTESGADAAYFCGKCLLKLRGWKVEGLTDPAGNLGGP